MFKRKKEKRTTDAKISSLSKVMERESIWSSGSSTHFAQPLLFVGVVDWQQGIVVGQTASSCGWTLWGRLAAQRGVLAEPCKGEGGKPSSTRESRKNASRAKRAH